MAQGTVLNVAKILHKCGGKPLASETYKLVENLLQGLTSSEVQLDRSLEFLERSQPRHGRPPIAYIRVYEHPSFSMGIFSMPPETALPLHDHPQMYGFIRALGGQVGIQSYTLTAYDGDSGCYRAIGGEETVLTENDRKVGVLHPQKNNVHMVYPLNEARGTFFDILYPKYDPDQGRECNFYQRVTSDSGEPLLKSIGPEQADYFTVNVPYFGVNISLEELDCR